MVQLNRPQKNLGVAKAGICERIGGMIARVWLAASLLACMLDGGEAGRVDGKVVDPESQVVAGATIRMLPRGTGLTKYRSHSRSDGVFRIDEVVPGSYIVAVYSPGFRERFLNNVELKAGDSVGLGTITLELAGCDGPGTFCDYFDGRTPPDDKFSRGDLTLRTGCRVDIDHGRAECGAGGDTPNGASDFEFRAAADGRLYLEPRNGARLAEPNSAHASCRGAVFGGGSVRIDGLGMGSDVCLRSSEGRVSQIFFTAEMRSGDERIAIHYVTWK